MFSQLAEMTPESDHVGNFGILEKRFKNEDYGSELEAFVAKIK
jgi:hypothetical protein